MGKSNKGNQEGGVQDSGKAEGDIQQGQLEGSDISGADEVPADEGYKPLFEEEAGELSKDDLTGEDDEAKPSDKKEGDDKSSKDDDKSAKSGSEDDKSSDKKEGDEADKDKKDAEDKKDAKADDKTADKDKKEGDSKEGDEKPPPGFVPKQALDDERETRKKATAEVKALKDEILILNQSISDLQAGIKTNTSEKEEEEFKVLTDKEYEELAEDDPTEAAKYMYQLSKHNEKKRLQDEETRAQEAKTSQAKRIISQSYGKIEEAVPGIYGEKSKEIQKELVDFAVDTHGFNEAFFEIMTNPETVVIVPSKENGGRESRIVLSDGAASLVGLVHKFATMTKEHDPGAIRESLKKELEKEITEKLLKKFKGEGKLSEEDFRQIGDITPSDSEGMDSAFGDRMVSDAELRKMSEKDRRAYLGE